MNAGGLSTSTPATPASVAAAPAFRQPEWARFVRVRVGAAAGIVAIAAILGSALKVGTALGALLTIAVAGAAAFVVGAMIVEDFDRAAKALVQDVDRAAAGALDSIHDPMGTEASGDLVNALNRLAARVRAADNDRR